MENLTESEKRNEKTMIVLTVAAGIIIIILIAPHRSLVSLSFVATVLLSSALYILYIRWGLFDGRRKL